MKPAEAAFLFDNMQRNDSRNGIQRDKRSAKMCFMQSKTCSCRFDTGARGRPRIGTKCYIRAWSRSCRSTLYAGHTCNITAPTIVQPAKTCARRNCACSRSTNAPAIGVPAIAPKDEIPHIIPSRVPIRLGFGQKIG